MIDHNITGSYMLRCENVKDNICRLTLLFHQTDDDDYENAGFLNQVMEEEDSECQKQHLIVEFIHRRLWALSFLEPSWAEVKLHTELTWAKLQLLVSGSGQEMYQ